MNVVIEVLLDTPPAEVDALVILNEFLTGPDLPDPQMLLEQQERIRTALYQLRTISATSQKVIELCLQAKAIPSPTVPIGF